MCMKIKTTELIGQALDLAVANALGVLKQAPNTCQSCHHFEEISVRDGSDYLCHLGDLSWSGDGCSDQPFGDAISAAYGIHERCPLKAGTKTEAYSTLWAQGGPIIERERITISDALDQWVAGLKGTLSWFGPTPLIAAMRCYVASKLGGEVEVPDELILN